MAEIHDLIGAVAYWVAALTACQPVLGALDQTLDGLVVIRHIPLDRE